MQARDLAGTGRYIVRHIEESSVEENDWIFRRENADKKTKKKNDEKKQQARAKPRQQKFLHLSCAHKEPARARISVRTTNHKRERASENPEREKRSSTAGSIGVRNVTTTTCVRIIPHHNSCASLDLK